MEEGVYKIIWPPEEKAYVKEIKQMGEGDHLALVQYKKENMGVGFKLKKKGKTYLLPEIIQVFYNFRKPLEEVTLQDFDESKMGTRLIKVCRLEKIKIDGGLKNLISNIVKGSK